MNIYIYFKRLLRNGTEFAILDLVKNLKRKFTIVYSEDDNDEDMIKMLSEYAEVKKYQKDMKCDIIIYATQYFDFKNITFNASKRYQWVHNSPFQYVPSSLYDKEFTSKIDLFICVSEATSNELIYFDGDFNTIVIHNFFDAEKILYLSKEECKLPEKSIVIVSRISSEKGIYRLDLFADKIPDWNIYVIGEAYDEYYNQLTMRFLRKQDNVHFLGYQNNPFKYIKNADYLMVLSTHEGWNRTITEARIIGKPIISTNFDGVEEQVKDGVNGYIFDMDFKRDINVINNILKVEPIKWENEINKWEMIL